MTGQINYTLNNKPHSLISAVLNRLKPDIFEGVYVTQLKNPISIDNSEHYIERLDQLLYDGKSLAELVAEREDVDLLLHFMQKRALYRISVHFFAPVIEKYKHNPVFTEVIQEYEKLLSGKIDTKLIVRTKWPEQSKVTKVTQFFKGTMFDPQTFRENAGFTLPLPFSADTEHETENTTPRSFSPSLSLLKK